MPASNATTHRYILYHANANWTHCFYLPLHALFAGYHHELRALYSKSSPDGYYAMRARTDLDGAVVGNELLIFEGAHHVYSPTTYKVHRYNMDTHTLKDPETTTGTMPPLYRDANTGRSVTVIGTNVRHICCSWP